MILCLEAQQPLDYISCFHFINKDETHQASCGNKPAPLPITCLASQQNRLLAKSPQPLVRGSPPCRGMPETDAGST